MIKILTMLFENKFLSIQNVVKRVDGSYKISSILESDFGSVISLKYWRWQLRISFYSNSYVIETNKPNRNVGLDKHEPKYRSETSIYHKWKFVD